MPNPCPTGGLAKRHPRLPVLYGPHKKKVFDKWVENPANKQKFDGWNERKGKGGRGRGSGGPKGGPGSGSGNQGAEGGSSSGRGGGGAATNQASKASGAPVAVGVHRADGAEYCTAHTPGHARTRRTGSTAREGCGPRR